MVAQFPCRACQKNVNKNHHAFLCDHCETWIHRKCNNLTKQDYDFLANSDEPFICICCIKENLPFSSLSDKNFNIAVVKGINYLYDEIETELSPLTNAQINKNAALHNSPHYGAPHHNAPHHTVQLLQHTTQCTTPQFTTPQFTLLTRFFLI